MTDYELEAISKTFAHILKVGAPGFSESMRMALVTQATIRLRHQFNVVVHPVIFPPPTPMLRPSEGKSTEPRSKADTGKE